jgi:hypothetical protein
MKKLSALLILLSLVVTGLTVLNSCSDKDEATEIDLPEYTGNNIDEASILNEIDFTSNSDLKCGNGYPEVCGTMKFYPLIASKYYYAGALFVFNDETNLYVSYWTGGYFKLTDFHLYVGTAEMLPLTQKGNPKIGQFPYKDEYSRRAWKVFTIPLSEIPECYTMVAHAVLGRHTVFAYSGNAFSGQRWGWTIEDCIDECVEDDIMILKSKLVDTVTGEDYWATISDVSFPYDEAVEWCSTASTVVPVDGATYDLARYGNTDDIIGSVSIEMTDDVMYVTMTSAETDLVFQRTNLFYGTQEELDATPLERDCPDYGKWPKYLSDQSSYTIEVALD